MNLVCHRRTLHRIPEPDFRLPETLAYVESVLSPLNCTLHRPAESSICAFFDFGQDEALAFRADMDALPIPENSGLDFSSQHPGYMHACGHDGHMAILLGFAQWVSQQNEMPHNILLIFQPAEETIGGAKPICESGILSRFKTKAVFGLHLWPDLLTGKVSTRPGGMMCRTSEVTLRVTGKPAHVARAEEGLDALEATARWYLAALEAEKNTPGSLPRLLKFGRIEAGTVRNALAGNATLEGSMRAFEDETFYHLKGKLEDLATAISNDTGCSFDLHFSEGYPAVDNHPEVYARLNEIAHLEYLDEPVKIAEDFSWYQRYVPGVFFFLGCGPAPALHSQNFNFDEKALDVGLELFKTIALRY